jgi:hypothetical protein
MKIDKVYAGIIIVLAVVVVYMFYQPGQAVTADLDKQAAGDVVKQIYELQYETQAEILSVNETSGLYKVTVKFTDYNRNQTTNEIFVTKDGKLIADRLIVAESYNRLLSAQKIFVECLNAKGLRILGKSNDTATLQQLNVLGIYAYKLYVSCDGVNEQTCIDIGVGRYPTAVYNNTGYDSIYTAQFFSELTGCTV